MIFQSLEFTGERPFENVLIHGLIRDEQGRKMSKSLGNGIDPMEVIESMEQMLSAGSYRMVLHQDKMSASAMKNGCFLELYQQNLECFTFRYHEYRRNDRRRDRFIWRKISG